MVKVTSLLIEAESALGFSFGVRTQIEMTHGALKACICSSSLKWNKLAF